MKARIPKGLGGFGNLHELAKKAEQVQAAMDEANKALETKEYSATSGGSAVSVTVLGSMEIKEMKISPEVVDPEDVEMLCDLVKAATNEALRTAAQDKKESIDKISNGLQMPGLF